MTEWGSTEYALLGFNIVGLFIAYKFIKFRLTSKLEEIEKRKNKSSDNRGNTGEEGPIE